VGRLCSAPCERDTIEGRPGVSPGGAGESLASRHGRGAAALSCDGGADIPVCQVGARHASPLWLRPPNGPPPIIETPRWSGDSRRSLAVESLPSKGDIYCVWAAPEKAIASARFHVDAGGGLSDHRQRLILHVRGGSAISLLAPVQFLPG